MFLEPDDPSQSIRIPDALPVLPLRDAVVLPMTFAPISVTVDRSVRLVGDAMGRERLVATIAQRDDAEFPAPSELHRVGTMAVIREMLRPSEDAVHIAVQGIARVGVVDFVQLDPYLVARVVPLPEIVEADVETEALARTAHDLFGRLVPLIAEVSDDLAAGLRAIADPKELAYLVASTIPMSAGDRQSLLELDSTKQKLSRVVELLRHELSVRQLLNKIAADTQAEISKAQREAILRKHLEQIQRELGDSDPEAREIEELKKKIHDADMPGDARKEALREVDRLARTPIISPEHAMIRGYVEWLAKMPWNKTTGASIDAAAARRVLDEDHYDIEKVKERIVEHLAVKRLREERAADAPSDEHARREPILCFVGPPGTGKTSLGQSIARAMGRRFVRMSLGGLHDEAEIRGHRRTYVGALPGRIVQAMARAETSDPVLMLDEVDKLAQGFHGDPSAALLEVLDPAQNHAFVDAYLGMPLDLSRVLFLCTANTTDPIPPALLDRMEVLPLAGYTDFEKLQIARRFLLPKAMRAHGLRDGEVVIDDPALMRIIREHTREAGVRALGRELAAILRKSARRIGEGSTRGVTVGADDVRDYLGAQRFFDEMPERAGSPGVATGLAWTPHGGDILFVEATSMPSDDERLVLTGMLGDVMRESAQAALSYLRSNAERLRIGSHAFDHRTVHVHVPAGAIPKDGPSAGVTILAALASHATGRPTRHDVAMTGEITLRGKILPVAGIKEKALAAHRAGIRTIVLPRRNEAALEEVPKEVRDAIAFVLVESADDVLGVCLESEHVATGDAAVSVH